MSSNILFVAAGQCGNQLGYELVDYLYAHATDKKYIASACTSDPVIQSKMEEVSRIRLIDSVFDTNSSINYDKIDPGMLTARIVGLDTEPKVLEDCIAHTQRNKRWKYDVSSIAYRHGGAGNNWALGYEMASGEFLDVSLNCMRKQIEKSDCGLTLCFLHSLAGGTGSGLGTRMTESCADVFSDMFRMNITVAPHHFGEVVVQYYNALLCLSKVASTSNATLVFENEIASLLCREMLRIEKPLLKDLNYSIASNLLPLFLPKMSPIPTHLNPPSSSSPLSMRLSSLPDDISHLCSHPSYPFINMKLTPQTSVKSIDYTYDTYMSLLKTIQRLALSGTQIERFITKEIKNAGNTYMHDASSRKLEVVRSVGSVLTCHGESAHATAQHIQDILHSPADEGGSLTHNSSQSLQTPTKSRHSSQSAPPGSMLSPPHGQLEGAVLPEFLISHSTRYDMMFSNHPAHSVRICSSVFALNRYQRSCTMVCNDQSILPILQRPYYRAQELFQMKAYLHQYEMYNIHQDDFVGAFQELSGYIQNYAAL
ncbi:hypothetical protein EON65_21115 [archaeon]|nr:MAG: hypothetical protein EON65_21115 [archaeon]